MVEREVIIRSVKHILNQHVRENISDELLGALISHIFNCLFAPKDFIKKMDDGVVKYQAMTLNHLSQENKPDKKVSEKQGDDEQKASKKDKKKQKKEGKKDENKDEQSGEGEQTKTFTYDIGELLFKSPYEDIIFEANEVFMDT